jgi:hypothetical protein
LADRKWVTENNRSRWCRVGVPFFASSVSFGPRRFPTRPQRQRAECVGLEPKEAEEGEKRIVRRSHCLRLFSVSNFFVRHAPHNDQNSGAGKKKMECPVLDSRPFSFTHFLSDIRHDDQSSGASKRMCDRSVALFA